MFKWFKRPTPARCAAIIAAGGEGTRMGGGGKQLIELDGLPMIARTLLAFERAASVEAVIVVANERELPDIARIVDTFGAKKVIEIVRGGESRMASVAAGLKVTPPEYTLIAIHDGARPLVSPSLIDAVVERAGEEGAAAAGIRPVDTMRSVRDGAAGDDLERDKLVAMQTPQAFGREEYDVAIAYALTQSEQYTDDVAVYRTLKKHVAIVEGERANIKVTTPEDVAIAEALIEAYGR